VFAILLVTLAAFIFAPPTPLPHSVSNSIQWQNIVLSVAAGLFAFGGWHMVTYVAGETIRPERTIPLALLLGTSVVTVCYIALNAAYVTVLPLDKVAASDRIAADAADAVMGRGGGILMAVLVVFSGFGSLNGVILAGPRVYYAMAQDGLAFRWLGEVHTRFQTPHRALWLQAIWSSLLVAAFSYRDLFMSVVYTEWIFFALMVAGIFILRRRSNYAPAYHMWGHPFTSAIFIAASLVIVVMQIAEKPGPRLMGLALVALGLPVYYLWKRAPRAKTNPDLVQ
jgi:APA family basic amino acid/polyamine antiporter